LINLSLKRRYFDELASRWDQRPVPTDAPARVRRFVERAARPGARRILDVGCGTGLLLPSLLAAYPTATCFAELDFALEMLKENARKLQDGRVARVCADARRLPFPAESYDLVLCFGVLPHLGDSRAAVEECFRVLAPAGVFAVGHMMGSRELNELHSSLGGPLAGDRLLSPPALASILEAAGAAVLSAEESVEWYFVSARKGQG
jgi:ubiquinone/menaquinone biosynthesis C-methylase UbiE